MLRRYKAGRKIKLKWQVLINNRAPRYEDEFTLQMCDPHLAITELDFIIERGYIVADVPQLWHLGDYTFTLSNKEICIDCRPFEIVRESLDETDCVVSDSVSVGITGASAYEVWAAYQKQIEDRDYTEDEFFEALRGFSAFQVWQQDGHTGQTLADYYVWLSRNSGFEAWLSLPENEGKIVRDFVNEMQKPQSYVICRNVADILREHGITPPEKSN